MIKKPASPYPIFLRRILKKILSEDYYTTLIGRHERTSIAIWELISIKIKPDESIFDIGAYHGEYAKYSRLNNIKSKIFAFEPNPLAIDVLRSNCKNLDIKIQEIALSDREGKFKFFINGKASSLKPNKSNQVSLEVETRTIDSFVQEHIKSSPKLIKIDTEGNEPFIINGGINTIKKYNPIILCEVLNDEIGKSIDKVLPDNYIYYHIDEKYKSLKKKIVINRKLWRNRNWLFVPNTEEENIKKLGF